MTEITEKRLQKLLSSSTEYVTNFISEHPEVIYKGIPLMIAVYILSPMVIMTWQYLPWIWATYEIYRRVPTGSIPIAIEVWKSISYQSN